MFVGNDRPHKRFSLLLEVWASLARVWSSPKELPLLVAVGSKFSNSIKETVSRLGLEQNVRFLSNLPTSELSALYGGAETVLIPSREEGFGLVALEAFTCGTQVITTPMPSIREVCGSLAHYAADFSSGSFYEVIAHQLHQTEFAEVGREERKYRASFFVRERAAQLTCSTYYKVLGLKPSERLTRNMTVERIVDAGSLCNGVGSFPNQRTVNGGSGRIH
jgi:glycosyltransferase involved in cell wall biosynthesis